MVMRRRIGRLEPRPFGYRVICEEPDCGWYEDENNKTDPVEIGTRNLRFHAGVMHPQPIPVYELDDE